VIAAEPATDGDDRLVTTAQAAEILGVSSATLVAWNRIGQGPRPIKLGARLVWYHSQIVKWERLRRRQCLPWCVEDTGEHSAFDPDPDDPCFGSSVKIGLSLEPLIPDEQFDQAAQTWVPAPDSIDVYASAPAVDQVEIRVEHSETDGLPVFNLRLTTSEAQELVEALQLVLGQVAGGER
jgi:predicted DNA-binding transcriptional regulator AlpA